MRFMLLQNYGEVESDCPPMTEWTPEDIKAHIEFQQVLNQELTERGELVDAQGLAGPEHGQVRRVRRRRRPGDHRRPVPRVEGAARRLPDDRRRDDRPGDRDRGAGVGGARARTACRSASPSRCARC